MLGLVPGTERGKKMKMQILAFVGMAFMVAGIFSGVVNGLGLLGVILVSVALVRIFKSEWKARIDSDK